MNRIRLASLLCIVLAMLILTARFGTQRANLATPPSTFEATTIAVAAASTAHARTIASPTTVASPVATSIPQSTRTPRPTKTPRPTRTPLATATVSDTTASTPAPPVDQGTSDYYAQLSPALQAITRGLDTLGQLAQHPQLNDAAWQANVRAASDAITTSRATITALKPPAAMDALHANAFDAANSCGEAMDKLDAAMKTADGADLLATATLSQNCATKVQHVQEQIPR